MRPPGTDQNMPYLSPYHQLALNPQKIKFHGNGQIPQLGSKFCVPWKTVVPADNRGRIGENMLTRFTDLHDGQLRDTNHWIAVSKKLAMERLIHDDMLHGQVTETVIRIWVENVYYDEF